MITVLFVPSLFCPSFRAFKARPFACSDSMSALSVPPFIRITAIKGWLIDVLMRFPSRFDCEHRSSYRGRL